METETVDVMFRVYREGEVFALFPGLAGAVGKLWECLSYQHVGQHGSADLAFCIQTSRPAKPEEKGALIVELCNRGYRLREVSRSTCRHTREREQQLTPTRRAAHA